MALNTLNLQSIQNVCDFFHAFSMYGSVNRNTGKFQAKPFCVAALFFEMNKNAVIKFDVDNSFFCVKQFRVFDM